MRHVYQLPFERFSALNVSDDETMVLCGGLMTPMSTTWIAMIGRFN